VGAFCSSLESIRIRRQPEGLSNGLQKAMAKQNNRRDGVRGAAAGEGIWTGRQLRGMNVAPIFSFQLKITQVKE